MKLVKIISCLLFVVNVSYASAPGSFDKAKTIALKLFSTHRTTLYCGCSFNQDKSVDLASCNMGKAKGVPRSERIEWEHMMPASQFGQNFACWNKPLCTNKKGKKYKGRKCCEKIDKKFRAIESELYNLWPANGLINEKRSNYEYSQLYPVQSKKTHDLYGCSVVVDRNNNAFEPSDDSKGIVARAMLFMAMHYKIKLTHDFESLMKYWHQQYPPTKREKLWAKKVAEIEGYANPYIS